MTHVHVNLLREGCVCSKKVVCFPSFHTPGASEGASAPAAVPPLSASGASLFGAVDKFKKPEGSWDCDVCLLQNKAADVQCVACQAAKPGAKVEPKGKKENEYLLHSIYKYYQRMLRSVIVSGVDELP